MKFFQENRKRGALVLVLAILFTLGFGTWRTAAGLESRVEKAYNQEDEFGATVRGTLKDLIYHARSFATAYTAAMEGAEEDEFSRTLTAAADALESGLDNPAGLGTEYQKLQYAARQMYERLQVGNLYWGDLRAAYMWVDNDLSILKKYDQYNKAAKDYNEKTSHFPASLFAKDTAVIFD